MKVFFDGSEEAQLTLNPGDFVNFDWSNVTKVECTHQMEIVGGEQCITDFSLIRARRILGISVPMKNEDVVTFEGDEARTIVANWF